MVMVDEPPVFGPSQHYFTSGIVFGLPDQGRSFGNENGKHPSELGIGRTKFFGLGVLGFVADSKVTQRGFMFASKGMHAPGKAPPACAVVAHSAPCWERVGSTRSIPLILWALDFS